MPNDPAGAFPMPPTNNQPPIEPPKEEIKLTDEVAPDLSASPTQQPSAPVLTAPEPLYYPSAPRSEAQIPSEVEGQPAPVPQEPVYQPAPVAPAAPMPATMPADTGRPFPIVTILLLLISIGAIAATYFFYQQSKNLNLQLSEITRTLEQQKTKENQLTPTPTPSLTLTPSSTISATLSPSPTSTIPVGTGLAFGQIGAVFSAAQKQYPDGQLLMITATGVENPNTMIIKYWFRQTLADKKYFYVLSEPGKDLSVVDQQVYVTPDNNIPSLNQLAIKGQLGLDLDEAVTIAGGVCPTSFDCTNTPITGQYIKANTTLWQISFKPTGGAKPFVVQIDAATKKILFKNL